MKTIITKDLTIGYDNAILSNLKLTFKEGSFTTIKGRNGSGKSTLLKTLLGLLKPLSGDVFFDGIILNKLDVSKRRKYLSAVFSKTEFRPNIPVSEIISLSIDTSKRNEKKIVENALEKCNCLDLKNKRSDELSDGQFQKIMLARAFAQDTPIMILDEPTAFLDYENKENAFALLKQLAKKEMKIIIQATHDLEIAIKYSDDIIDVDTINK